MAKWLSDILTIGNVLTLLGLAFALYERRQRTKMESVVRETLRRLAGEMRVMFSNANWTNQHLRRVGHLFNEADPNLNVIRQETFDAARDAATCARQVSFMHSQIQGDPTR